MNQVPFSATWQAAFYALRTQRLHKRWVTIEDIEVLLPNLPKQVRREIIGNSAENRAIYKLIVGNGTKHVLAWAAMHGNESTAMRGWLDLFLNIENEDVSVYFNELLSEFTIHFIPMLNPDGAARYTRRNAMTLDMNRDAKAWQTPEMRILKAQFESVNPVLAFNLHDQRNIFAVKGKPATISFLAPSVDVERTVTPVRKRSMDLIGAASEALKPVLEGQIGRYTDEFYPTAIGEFAQHRGIPTILVECGPAKNDPLRQMARMANPIILHAVLERFTSVTNVNALGYEAIPVNETNQVDFIIQGIEIVLTDMPVKADLALLAEDAVVNGQLVSTYKVQDFGDLQQLIALDFHVWESTLIAPNVQVNALANFSFKTNKGVITFENGIKR